MSSPVKRRLRLVPDLDMADVYNFGNHPTEITVGGEKQPMTRHEIILFKLLESAGKGSIAAQKYLLEKFEEAEMSHGYLRYSLEKWTDLLVDDPDSITPEIMQLMRAMLEVRSPRRSKVRMRNVDKTKHN